jgi:hypothetical protein
MLLIRSALVFYLRLPILTFIALALALWLKAGSSDAQAKGRAPNSEGEKPKAEVTMPGPPAPAPAASAAAASPATGLIELKALSGSNPYEKLAKLLSGKPEAISWKDLKIALVELNISIPPISSALSTQMWKLAQAPEAEKRLAWVKSTEHVVTINRYVEESHGQEDSNFLKANRQLRAGGALDADLQKYVTSLDKALTKLPRLVGYTFRGATLAEKTLLEEYTEGKPVTEKAFTSSSLNPATAYAYAFPKESSFFRGIKPLAEGEVRVLFIIQGKSAHPVSYFSEFWAEAEALFNKGAEFNVKAVSPRQDDGSRYVVLEEK